MITYNGEVVTRVLFGGKEVERLYFRGILVFDKSEASSATLSNAEEEKEEEI